MGQVEHICRRQIEHMLLGATDAPDLSICTIAACSASLFKEMLFNDSTAKRQHVQFQHDCCNRELLSSFHAGHEGVIQDFGGANERNQANCNGKPPLIVILVKPARYKIAVAECSQHKGLRPQQAVPNSIEAGQGVCDGGPEVISKSCQCASECWRMLQQGALELLDPPLSILQSGLHAAALSDASIWQVSRGAAADDMQGSSPPIAAPAPACTGSLPPAAEVIPTHKASKRCNADVRRQQKGQSHTPDQHACLPDISLLPAHFRSRLKRLLAGPRSARHSATPAQAAYWTLPLTGAPVKQTRQQR